MRITERLSKGWNAFLNKDPTIQNSYYSAGYSSSINPGTTRFARARDQSIVDAIYNRIAMDCASIDIMHCRLDDNGRFQEKIIGPLNTCLELEPNLDQTARQFRQDAAISLLDWGTIAIVPVETDDNDDPNLIENYQSSIAVSNMRVGKIIEWKPNQILVRLYNEWTGEHEDLWFSKRAVCVIQNPFYDIMNRPNSAVTRLKNKLRLSDIIDEESTSNKFNMIIQMPYSIKTEGKRAAADKRIKDLEEQLAENKYGIGYIDATEHITQLNRALDNHILDSIQYYTDLVYAQFGLTPEIMNGTAEDTVMNNYYSRTIEPILSAICDEMKRKFLSKTARSQKQSIEFFRDPFKLVPVSQLPEIVDKFTRNEVMTTNEVRQVIGMRPSADPRADELRNKNLSEAKGEQHVDVEGNDITRGYAEATNDPQEDY